MAPFKQFRGTTFLICLLVGLNWQKAGAACNNGATTLSAYWVSVEGNDDISSTGFPIKLTGPKTRSIVDENGELIAYVAEPTLRKCQEEGLCYLDLLTILVQYVRGGNVFKRLNSDIYPLGVGAWNSRLESFVSLASSDFAPATKLYIKELDGIRLPPYFVPPYHNGCVRVDDVAPAACSVTLFVGFYRYYTDMITALPRQISVPERSNCYLLEYTIKG